MHLLDVNVLIAFCDPFHVHHDSVVSWFSQNMAAGWATCPLTENGFLRILGQTKYPGGPGSPLKARELLRQVLLLPGHVFWPDSISLCETADYRQLPTSKYLTDYYLLALAIEHRAFLATLDRHIDSSLLPGGTAACQIIPNN